MNASDKAILYDAHWREVAAGLALQVTMLRIARGWSREELAQRSGVPLSKLAAIEGGSVRGLTIERVIRLAQAFDAALTVRFTAWTEAIVTALKDKTARPSYEQEQEAGK